MDRTVIAIVGLPGSGKSRHRDRLARRLGWPTMNDPVLDCGGPIDAAQEVKGLLFGRPGAIVDDPSFCRADHRATFEHMLGGEARVRWVFFENDPEACLLNLLADAPGGRDLLIVRVRCLARLVGDYRIPEGAKARRVRTGVGTRGGV